MQEIRKIEVFRDGRQGAASIDGLEYLSFSSECNWSLKEEIEADRQFIIEAISKEAFENIWNQAMIKTSCVDE